jgi:hypothetical protein
MAFPASKYGSHNEAGQKILNAFDMLDLFGSA